MATWVLGGDVGGTKTNLALYRVEGAEGLRLEREDSFPSQRSTGLEEIVRAFLRDHSDGIAAAAFGVAGPVKDGAVRVTNLDWTVEAHSLATALGGAGVQLLNDLEATAYGALFLAPDELQTLNEGHAQATHRAVIAAGTGLGQAILFWDGERHQPSPTEGGHVDFAPRDDREMGLLRFLLERHDRVSYERVLSGPGLVEIAHYIERDRGGSIEPEVRERLRSEDAGAAIGDAGVSGRCAVCREAVELFVSLYGAQAANLALTSMALGGVYVGGGIVTKLLPVVTAGAFMQAFLAKGRFASLLADVPVQVILNPKTALFGAGRAALELTRAA